MWLGHRLCQHSEVFFFHPSLLNCAGERRCGLLRPGVDHHAADRLIEPVHRINFAMQPQ